jgi:hypothetical protein
MLKLSRTLEVMEVKENFLQNGNGCAVLVVLRVLATLPAVA